ncbi:uncharacterized protein LOC129975191 isoform X2 [Argiope bruennichi]|uniref:Uncharacterized protein n=1 Tax=Argiope bruennichi TaxID=94029 RepID=A0A8T0ERZ6_ARGBR|nr:uncharacterized protein LOC129975191 isoform X2 [Argiope bruennichi]KAF8776789.1 hypothetical protein HNY73_013735 [Argiope bruennichi]
MSNKQANYLIDTCHLHIPCQCKSRCSAKSHSSSCLSSQYENQYYEGGDKGPLWFTREEEFPRLLTTPPSSREPDTSEVAPKKKKKKRKKKSFAIDVVTGASRVRSSSDRKTHRCHRGGGCKRQRLHSEDSSNKRSSGMGRDFEHSRRARLAVVVVAFSLILLSFLLVGLTLRMAPIIDELVRKGNEEIYRSMSAGASTSSPTTEDAVVANNTTPSSGTPG